MAKFFVILLMTFILLFFAVNYVGITVDMIESHYIKMEEDNHVIKNSELLEEIKEFEKKNYDV